MHIRTGPQAARMASWYSAGRSRPSLRTASDITCQRTSTSRTFSTSRTQRLAIQAHGQMGSNQKSALAMTNIFPHEP
jgi:hypothetical protein